MKFKFKFLAGILMMVLMSGFASAYSGGGGTCNCGDGTTALGGNATDACVDCNAALNDNANCANQVNYVGTVAISNYTGTCINSPANNKIFDCQRHTIDGDDSGTWYNPTYGIYLSNKSGNTIKNCVISDFYTNIYLESSPNNTLMNNTLNSSYDSAMGSKTSNIDLNNTYVISYHIYTNKEYKNYIMYKI